MDPYEKHRDKATAHVTAAAQHGATHKPLTPEQHLTASVSCALLALAAAVNGLRQDQKENH